MKKTRVIIIVFLVSFLVNYAIAEEKIVLNREKAIEKEGAIISLTHMGKEKIREKEEFFGYRWEWIIEIRNDNPVPISMNWLMITQNDLREPLIGHLRYGKIVIESGQKQIIPFVMELWGTEPRRRGWVNLKFSIKKEEKRGSAVDLMVKLE